MSVSSPLSSDSELELFTSFLEGVDRLLRAVLVDPALADLRGEEWPAVRDFFMGVETTCGSR